MDKSRGCFEFENAALGRYLDALGSSRPAPGGGSAAALAGALGAALVEMAARINYRRGRRISSSGIAALKKIRTRFVRLAGLDAACFERLSGFSKEERTGTGYGTALKKAAGVPLEMSELTVRAAKSAYQEKGATSSWLMSDLAEAGLLLEAAFRSARLQAEANIGGIRDKEWVRRLRGRLDRLEKEISFYRRKLAG